MNTAPGITEPAASPSVPEPDLVPCRFLVRGDDLETVCQAIVASGGRVKGCRWEKGRWHVGAWCPRGWIHPKAVAVPFKYYPKVKKYAKSKQQTGCTTSPRVQEIVETQPGNGVIANGNSVQI